MSFTPEQPVHNADRPMLQLALLIQRIATMNIVHVTIVARVGEEQTIGYN